MKVELANDNNSMDFLYFNEINRLFEEKKTGKTEERLNNDKLDNISEQESTNNSFENQNNENDHDDEKELKLLPLNLLDIETNDLKNIDKLDLNSKPFIPKSKLFSSNNKNVWYINNKKNKNDKKKKFSEKKGDWICYACKNINFIFRDVCNRCKLSKEDSDKKYEEAFKTLETLYKIN